MPYNTGMKVAKIRLTFDSETLKSEQSGSGQVRHGPRHRRVTQRNHPRALGAAHRWPSAPAPMCPQLCGLVLSVCSGLLPTSGLVFTLRHLDLGGEFGGECIHVCEHLGPLTVHWKLSHHCVLISYTPTQNTKIKKDSVILSLILRGTQAFHTD